MPALNNTNKNKELIYPELSYKIIGAAFSVFNELGWGFSEKHYQKVLAEELNSLNINYKREVFIPFKYKTGQDIRYFADFIVENKILLEFKVTKKMGYTQARQILDYLKTSNLKLGILVYFTFGGVKYRRILNATVR